MALKFILQLAAKAAQWSSCLSVSKEEAKCRQLNKGY